MSSFIFSRTICSEKHVYSNFCELKHIPTVTTHAELVYTCNSATYFPRSIRSLENTILYKPQFWFPVSYCTYAYSIYYNMVANFKVFKKSSPNNKLTIYLGKRDIVDHISGVEPIGNNICFLFYLYIVIHYYYY